MAPSNNEVNSRSERPLWSLINESTCRKLADSCRSQITILETYIRWLKRFSLLCSLATAAVAAGTATTTLLIPAEQFTAFKDGISSFLYVSSVIAGVPKIVKIPQRVTEASKCIGALNALESRLFHEISLMIAAEREDVATFLQNSYEEYNKVVSNVEIPKFLGTLLGTTTADEEEKEGSSFSAAPRATNHERNAHKSILLHTELMKDPSKIYELGVN